MNGQKLKVVDKFTYLGSTLSSAVHIDDDVTARIAKTSRCLMESSLIPSSKSTRLWYCQPSCMHVRLGQYTSVMQRGNHFHLSCLRKLLKIKWQDKIPETEVLKKAGLQSMHTVLKLAQLRWTDHVIRMPDERLPKKDFYEELQEGKRSQGDQKKRHKDTLEKSL